MKSFLGNFIEIWQCFTGHTGNVIFRHILYFCFMSDDCSLYCHRHILGDKFRQTVASVGGGGRQIGNFCQVFGRFYGLHFAKL